MIGEPSPTFALPSDAALESAIIGAILADPKVADDIIAELRPDALFSPINKIIYSAITEMKDAGKPVDLLTVNARLREKGLLDEIGGPGALAQNFDMVPSSMALGYVEKVHAAWRLRELYLKCKEGSEAALTQQDKDPDEVITLVEQSIFQVRELNSENQHLVSAREAMTQAHALFQRIWDDPNYMPGFGTGYIDLDKLLGGWQDANHYVIAARPSVGKTALALNIIEHAAMVEKIPTAVFSLEMPVNQLALRLAAQRARIDVKRLYDGSLSKPDFDKLGKATLEIAEAPIVFDDSGESTIQSIRATCRRLKRSMNIGLVVVDYLQLVNTANDKHNQRETEVAEVSKLSKGGAKELNVPWISLCQLNRMVENRADGTPKLSDLRESGSIEQDADAVVFLKRSTRPDLIDEDGNKEDNSEERSKAELIVAKNRNGPTGAAHLTFLEKFTRFESAAKTGQQNNEPPKKTPPPPAKEQAEWFDD